jgi:hypothetical protein
LHWAPMTTTPYDADRDQRIIMNQPVQPSFEAYERIPYYSPVL